MYYNKLSNAEKFQAISNLSPRYSHLLGKSNIILQLKTGIL